MHLDSQPPDGFQLLNDGSDFLVHNGPLYERCVPGNLEDFRYSLTLRVQDKHTNSFGSCHGGMLTTLSDALTGFAARYFIGDKPVVTVSLNTDFSDYARVGEWIQGTARISAETRSLIFVSGNLCVDDRTLAVTQAVWKKVSESIAPQPTP